MNRITASLLAALVLMTACEPEDVPRYSPDGRWIALIRPSKTIQPSEHLRSPGDLIIINVKTQRAETIALPENWSAGGFTWTGDKVLVRAFRPIKPEQLPDAGGRKLDAAHWRIDPAGDHATRLKQVELPIGFNPPFVAPFKGNDALYVSDIENERTIIFNLDATEKLASREDDLESAGQGWMLQKVFKDGNEGLTKDLVHVDMFDSNERHVGRLHADEIAKACFRSVRPPMCASVSGDGQAIVLGFETSTIFRRHTHEYTFGVFDIRRGKFLWGGSSNPMTGLPVLEKDHLYLLEAKSRKIDTGDRTIAALGEPPAPTGKATHEIVLARHDKAGRRVIADLPLVEGDIASHYSSAPDRKSFLLQVEGKKPRLLIIPIKDAIDADEIKTIELPG